MFSQAPIFSYHLASHNVLRQPVFYGSKFLMELCRTSSQESRFLRHGEVEFVIVMTKVGNGRSKDATPMHIRVALCSPLVCCLAICARKTLLVLVIWYQIVVCFRAVAG